MYLQNKESVYDLVWGKLHSGETVTYGDVHLQDEKEWSYHNFEHADVSKLIQRFNDDEVEAQKMLAAGLVIPAYDYALKCSHTFNVLDARGAVSVTERAGYIARVRDMAKGCAAGYLESREKLGFPMLKGKK